MNILMMEEAKMTKSKKNMTQEELLLDYLQNHKKGIDRFKAWRLGIANLPARVFDLRQDGHKITMTKKKCVNQYGNKTDYAIYTLEA